jgi:hypothetical protein
MFTRLRPRRFDHGTVVAYLALFVAVGGTGAYAADTIGSSDIIDESILSQDIKQGEVRSSDLRGNSVLTGEIAAGNVTNTDLADGAVASEEVLDFGLSNEDVGVLFAVVNADGTLQRGSANVTSSKLVASTGHYVADFGRDVTQCAYTATVGMTGLIGGSTFGITNVGPRGNTPTAVNVRTHNHDGALIDRPFHLVVVC